VAASPVIFARSSSGLKAEIDLASWPVPPIFKYLASSAKSTPMSCFSLLNLGVGMILIVPPKNVRSVEADLKKRREKILPHRPHRARRIRQGSRHLLRLA